MKYLRKETFGGAVGGGIIVFLSIVLFFSLTSGNEKLSEPLRDAPIRDRNNAPADTITMPDGFSNVAVKCDGPNMVYVIFKGNQGYGSVAVAPNDPRCK